MTTVSPLEYPKRIKTKFIAPYALVLLIVLHVFVAAFYAVEMRVRDRDLSERSAAVSQLFEQKLAKDTNLMMATTRALMTNAAMESAFERGDREEVARLGDGLFSTLQAEHRITHLYLVRPDLATLYRFHSPGQSGDRIERATMLKAHDSQGPVRGLDLGVMGTLTLRLVLPWKRDGVVVGYVEIGKEIEHLIDEISQSLGVDLLVLVDKAQLSRSQWEQGQALMKRTGDWERFDTRVIIAKTSAHIPPTLDHTKLAALLAGDTTEIQDQGRTLHLAPVPFRDTEGHELGELVVLRDITALEEMFQLSIGVAIGVSLLVGLGLLAVLYAALDRVERDYRRQHELEHQLLRLDTEHQRILQLEKLSALGTMVGSISHQLNNPLVGVVNLAQLAERDVDAPAHLRELLHDIRVAGEDCRDFVKRMLAFSRVSGFERKPTDMASLIEDTVLLFRQAVKEHPAVEMDLPTTPVNLSVDPVLIRHALFNLFMNASQHSSADGPPITISLTPHTDATRGVPGWSLTVTDHGRGMTPEVLAQIFAPFFTTRTDGTGLGLPVVQHVALLHDGQVTASSKPGSGTRIALWLPDSPSNAASAG
ncbi:ATP-binding protein [Thauera aromatica]|uniref:histidine kinase n=1 Tax=Thauera aromatica K172 TaxID=44139 RepID=A0A2R4BRN7_THAAR|nr:ATP-binding protein [Thauera aromatica]AVR89998.1 histidine kinase [Thauera aromatica K172]